MNICQAPKQLEKKKRNPAPGWEPRHQQWAASPHFYMLKDAIVRRSDAMRGRIIQATVLYAVVKWDTGELEEIEQFDPAYDVAYRGSDHIGRVTELSVQTEIKLQDIQARLL